MVRFSEFDQSILPPHVIEKAKNGIFYDQSEMCLFTTRDGREYSLIFWDDYILWKLAEYSFGLYDIVKGKELMPLINYKGQGSFVLQMMKMYEEHLQWDDEYLMSLLPKGGLNRQKAKVTLMLKHDFDTIWQIITNNEDSNDISQAMVNCGYAISVPELGVKFKFIRTHGMDGFRTMKRFKPEPGSEEERENPDGKWETATFREYLTFCLDLQ